MSEDYKAALRSFMERQGRPVEFDERWGDKEPNVYGWVDYKIEDHIYRWETVGRDHKKVFTCGWVVPEGAILTEETYSQFAGTFTSNNQEVGINVEGCHCKCGRHTDVTLRFAGSLTEVLHDLLGINQKKPGIPL